MLYDREREDGGREGEGDRETVCSSRLLSTREINYNLVKRCIKLNALFESRRF